SPEHPSILLCEGVWVPVQSLAPLHRPDGGRDAGVANWKRKRCAEIFFNRTPGERGQAMEVLRLAVLGPPEVFHDESRLTFALRKAQALLLYLAVEGGMHPRSKLAAFLWPDSEPHAARTGLRTALTLLRSLLADSGTSAAHSHLLAEQDLLGLNP